MNERDMQTMNDQDLVNALREHAEWARANEWETPITLGDDLVKAADRIEAQAKEIEKLRAQLRHLEELAEADRDGRLVVLPFTSGRTLLCKENIDSPRLMKDVELAIRYCSSCGIVFHMGYNVFCDLVKHGRITAVSEEAEKALEAMKDGN
jgi:hypothetical protein